MFHDIVFHTRILYTNDCFSYSELNGTIFESAEDYLFLILIYFIPSLYSVEEY